MMRRHPGATLFPYTTLFRSGREDEAPYGDIRWHARAIVYDNPPTWGLGDVDARRISPRVSMLDFSWDAVPPLDRKSTRLNSSHVAISYAVFCLKKKITVIAT